MKTRELLVDAATKLRQAGIDNEENEACLLLGHVLNLSRTKLFLAGAELVSPENESEFNTLFARRIAREPLAYIMGEQEFWSLPFHVNPHVLIPRPETEVLIEKLRSQYISNDFSPARILDLGTGSGAIAVVLALEFPRALVTAVDRSPGALDAAAKNARRHGVRPRIDFICCDWLGGISLSPYFDLVVSNPPYIAREDISTLEPEVRFFEPRQALDGGEDGLESIRCLLGEVWRVLQPQGWLFMEIGSDQGESVQQFVAETGHYTAVALHGDYAGRDRILQARKA